MKRFKCSCTILSAIVSLVALGSCSSQKKIPSLFSTDGLAEVDSFHVRILKVTIQKEANVDQNKATIHFITSSKLSENIEMFRQTGGEEFRGPLSSNGITFYGKSANLFGYLKITSRYSGSFLYSYIGKSTIYFGFKPGLDGKLEESNVTVCSLLSNEGDLGEPIFICPKLKKDNSMQITLDISINEKKEISYLRSSAPYIVAIVLGANYIGLIPIPFLFSYFVSYEGRIPVTLTLSE